MILSTEAAGTKNEVCCGDTVKVENVNLQSKHLIWTWTKAISFIINLTCASKSDLRKTRVEDGS